MLAAADAVVDALRTVFEGRRDSVIVYADATARRCSTRGRRRSGPTAEWSGRLLSPSAVHHVDAHPNAA